MKKFITILFLIFSTLSLASDDQITKTYNDFIKKNPPAHTEYEPCTETDEGEAPAEYCAVYIAVKESGGAFDVWEHMPKFPDYKDTIRPYKIEFIKRRLGDSVFAKSVYDILYRDLEKIWHCLAKDDLECLANMTYIVDPEQLIGGYPPPQDKIKKGKWRIRAYNLGNVRIVINDVVDSGIICKDKGEYFKGILMDHSSSYKVSPYLAFSNPLEYYKCLFEDSLKVTTDSLITAPSPDHAKWLESVSMRSYIDIKYLLRTTFVYPNFSGIDHNKTIKENYPSPFMVNLASNPNEEESILLLYGTPANPNGFAIAGFGKVALDCENFCFYKFKDGP